MFFSDKWSELPKTTEANFHNDKTGIFKTRLSNLSFLQVLIKYGKVNFNG